MGILSLNRNLLSKFKPNSLSSSPFSSDLCCFSRVFSQAAVPPGTTNPQQQAHASPVVVPPGTINIITQLQHSPAFVGVLKRKPMFLIEHVVNGIRKKTLLSVVSAAAEWKRQCTTRSPFPELPELYRPVGSCKELILFWSLADHEDIVLVDEDGNSFQQTQPLLSLWNPRTNVVETLPPSLLPRPRRVFSIAFDCIGFGFDPKCEDYKLVCFLQYGGKRISLKNPFSYDAIEVYSLKTKTWKQITAPPFVVTPYFQVLTLHINGVHYWAMEDILSFDFAEEKFSHISLPDAPHIIQLVEMFCLAEFHGSLALIIPHWVSTVELLTEEEKQLQRPFSVEIWMWNGETWNVGPRVAVGDFPVDDDGIRALFLFQNDYLFLQGSKDAQLMLFNCKTGELIKNLGIHRDPCITNIRSITKPGIFPYTVPI